jgi:hypothetical protein
LELAERLLGVVNGVAARYRELSGAGLSVVCCMCFKLAMDHCFFEFLTDYWFLWFLDVAPTPQIITNQIPVQDSGILIVWDTDAIRHIALTPPSPGFIITDSILPTHDEFPVIEFGIGQFMAPLPHRISFPPTRTWGVAEFDPESLYWPSSEEPMAIFFRRAFQNYPSYLRRAAYETTQGYRGRILRDYSRMFEGFEVLANERRVNLYSGDVNTLESVEREIGEFVFLIYLKLTDWISFCRFRLISVLLSPFAALPSR